jgi:formylglycine-generating enzyme required for sulfatase activity/tetratricopeptide (TPR) repeat protein
MPFPSFMQAGLDKVLHASVNIDAIVNNAGSLSKLGSVLHKHFCTPAQHLLPAYRSSYQDTLKALRFTLNPPYVPMHSKIIKDFQGDVRAVLPTFPHTQLYKALAKECQSLEKQLLFSQASLQVGTKQAFEADLAALVGSKTLPNLTELILEDVQSRVEISAELLELLRLEDLLGCGIWHFLRADKQLSLLIAALQQEEIFQRVKRTDENVVEMLDLVRDIHRFAEKAGNNYADSDSANALAEAQRKLDTQQEKSCFTGLTQAFKNPDTKKARQLILQALKLAKTDAEKALVHYSLFKLAVSERNPDLQQAFEHLQQAIKLDKVNYAPCETDTFEIQALLGVGGMGYALLARSGAVELVVKCFWQELENKQFDEAVKMQKLQSQYVPTLFGNGIHRHRERLCLVTHYLPQAVDGARWLAQHGKLEENVGLVVAIRLAEALQAIHQAGVLHLDLKPANVLLLPAASAEDWEVRVIDFGLSKLLPPLTNHGRTQTMTGTASHTITLSLDYASPEQKAGEKLTAASDVFSYGKTVFVLVGDKESSEAPASLETVLRKCVRSRPEERINWAELLQMLRVPKQSSPEPKQNSPTPVQPKKEDKGIARTFSTVKAGKREDFTVYEKTFDIKGTELVMVYVPAGEFMMGSDEFDCAKPVHKVEIKQAFYMGKYPVTQGQYKAVMGDNPSDFTGNANLPAESMTWSQAKEFCEKLSQITKQAFRLPSEAEWEYACRAGTSTKYWWDDEMEDSRCWYGENSGRKTHSVDEKVNEHTNPFGLCDMSGNVWEWCEDDWEGDYKTPRTQKSFKNQSSQGVLRGGSWNNTARYVRSAYRNINDTTVRSYALGFRLMSLP